MKSDLPEKILSETLALFKTWRLPPKIKDGKAVESYQTVPIHVKKHPVDSRKPEDSQTMPGNG